MSDSDEAQAAAGDLYTSAPKAESGDKPPNYFDLVGQFMEVKRRKERNPVKAGWLFLEVFCNSFLCGIFLFIAALFLIAQLVIGILYQGKCDIQPWIPHWLIVSGGSGLVLTVGRFISITITGCRRKKDENRAKQNRCITCLFSLQSVFIFAWFLFGNYLVYSIHSRVQYDQQAFPHQYCAEPCYQFAFWSITGAWILIAPLCACLCGVSGFLLVCAARTVCYELATN